MKQSLVVLLALLCGSCASAQTQTIEPVEALVEQCNPSESRSSHATSLESLCLFAVRGASRSLVTPLEDGDLFSRRTVQRLKSRDGSYNNVLVQFEFEASSGSPAYKVVVFRMDAARPTPLLITSSWDGARVADANRDGIEDLVLTRNSFALKAFDSTKLPYILDGRNFSGEIPLRDATDIATDYMKSMSTELETWIADCGRAKSASLECTREANIDAMKLQIATLRRLLLAPGTQSADK